MSIAENKDNIEISGWVNEELDSVNIEREDFEALSEYFDSILKAANVASIETTFEEVGHEDVRLDIYTEISDECREVVLSLTISNWKEHTGGSSPYTRMTGNKISYERYAECDEPADDMVYSGAFYHLLSNSLSKINPRRTVTIWTPELSEYTEDYAVYETSISISTFDDL